MVNITDATDKYLTSRKIAECRPTTIDNYTVELRMFCEWSASQGVENVVRVSADCLRGYVAHLRTRRNRQSTATSWRILRRFLRWTWREYNLDGPRPWDNVEIPRVPYKQLNPVSPENVQALIDTCDSGTFLDLRDKAILEVLYSTGVRASELLGMSIHDVDWQRDAIRITHTKTYVERTVYLTKRAARTLHNYLRYRGSDHDMLWLTRSRTPMQYNTLRDVFRRRATMADLDSVPSAHSFRRAFGLACQRAGLDISITARLLGHADIATTMRYYVKYSDDDLRDSFHNAFSKEVCHE